MSLKLSDNTAVLSARSIDEIPTLFRALVTEKLADPGELAADGTWRSFQTPGDQDSAKPGRKAGFCSIDPLRMIGVYGSHRPGECPSTVVEIELSGPQPTEAERQERINDAQENRTRTAEEAAQRAREVWSRCEIDLRGHAYLLGHGVLEIAKTVSGDCVRLFPASNALVVPLKDRAGTIHNRQAIAADGRKKFLPGGRTEGLGLWVPEPPGGDQQWYSTEGFAKSLAVHAATGLPTLCAFSARNLTAALSEHAQQIVGHGVIAADGDQAGRTAVAEALTRFPQLRVAYPPAGLDWNDLLVKDGMATLKTLLEHPEPGIEWPAPASLPGDLPPVPPFNFELLPQAFQPWIADIGERMQCPAEYPAIGAMVALAAIVGRKVAIRPKRFDDWTVIPNLWGVIVGRPGLLKSPALHEALKPLRRLDKEASDAYQVAKVTDDAEREVREQRRQIAKANIRELLKKGGADNAALAAMVVSEAEQGPVRKRYIVNDSSVEKLGELLNQNPTGLLAFRDELLGLLSGLERVGQEGARQFYLEAWNGSGRFTYDRIGRGTIEIEACCLSILGSIQPDPLQTYLLTAPDDGLMQRFQLAVWPDATGDWHQIDRWPDKTAKEAAWAVFQRLDALVGLSIGAVPDSDGDVPCLRFDDAAQSEFDQWRAGLERRLRTEDLPPSLETVLSKHRSLIPSLALLIHLADRPEGGPVGLPSLIRAAAWGEFLEAHAQRVYSARLAPAVLSARALASKIRAGVLPEQFSIKEVYRPGWSRLSSSEQAQAGINMLIEHDWLRQQIEPAAATGGRPRTSYVVNPRVREG